MSRIKPRSPADSQHERIVLVENEKAERLLAQLHGVAHAIIELLRPLDVPNQRIAGGIIHEIGVAVCIVQRQLERPLALFHEERGALRHRDDEVGVVAAGAHGGISRDAFGRNRVGRERLGVDGVVSTTVGGARCAVSGGSMPATRTGWIARAVSAPRTATRSYCGAVGGGLATKARNAPFGFTGISCPLMVSRARPLPTEPRMK